MRNITKPPRAPKKLSEEAKKKAAEALHRNRVLSAEKQRVATKSEVLKQNKIKTVTQEELVEAY